jgi:hypothetical protein
MATKSVHQKEGLLLLQLMEFQYSVRRMDLEVMLSLLNMVLTMRIDNRLS